VPRSQSARRLLPSARAARGAVAAALLGVALASCAARRDEAPAQTADSLGPAATPAAVATPTVAVTPAAAPSPTIVAAPSPTAKPRAARVRQRTVALIGDSTTYGTPPPKSGLKKLQSPYNPGATLEALLASLEPPPAEGGTPWRDARVYNLAVGASTTVLWLQNPPVPCGSVLDLFPIVKAACGRGVSWVEAVPDAVEGRKLDAVIVDLGINDLLVTSDPRETVDRLVKIRDLLKPVPVLFYPPVAPESGPRGDWPLRVRAEMEKRGLFSEPQYPTSLPTYDGLHPTHGGYAAMGALWLDGLRKLP